MSFNYSLSNAKIRVSASMIVNIYDKTSVSGHKTFIS